MIQPEWEKLTYVQFAEFPVGPSASDAEDVVIQLPPGKEGAPFLQIVGDYVQDMEFTATITHKTSAEAKVNVRSTRRTSWGETVKAAGPWEFSFKLYGIFAGFSGG